IPEAANMIFDLRENFGVFCSMVVYPVVPKGQIMLRLIPTAAHTLNDVKETVEAFRVVRDRLAAGKYNKEKIAQF
ncbi:MAG TPA: pyridoxal phosphate-dependent aminotransferase family protein, partial [Tenuifilaceae bacterium]|nr:pyridoxal phosphate-dependent aminotransferase family protein [Tenuifilaceae bacterium]